MSRYISFLTSLVILSLTASASHAAVGVSPYGTQIKELHQIKVLLERADHDYKGHRAAAVKEITKAIHALGANSGQHQKTGVHPHTGKPHEAQALSDAQLRAAIQSLVTVSQQLQSAGAKNPRAGKAALDVQLAVKQLNMALAIK
jgi:hypothetical protein